MYRRFTLPLLNSLQYRLSFNSFKENLLINVQQKKFTIIYMMLRLLEKKFDFNRGH